MTKAICVVALSAGDMDWKNGMNDEPDGVRPTIAHMIGAKLDDLSIRDFDERIDLLRDEIVRLQDAK